MSWAQAVVDALRGRDVDVVAYIPDSVLDDPITRIEESEDFDAIRVSREEEAIAILSGAWMGGRRGALFCQSSGLANCFNVLGSHAKPEGLPFVGVVTRRGGVGEHNLAQAPGGYNMPRLLDDVGIRNRSVEPSDDIAQVVDGAAKSAFSTEDPFVLLLENTLTGGKPGR